MLTETPSAPIAAILRRAAHVISALEEYPTGEALNAALAITIAAGAPHTSTEHEQYGAAIAAMHWLVQKLRLSGGGKIDAPTMLTRWSRIRSAADVITALDNAAAAVEREL